MIVILIGILIFFLGFFVGFVFKTLDARKSKSSGTIYVNRDRVTEKIVYSLELDEYPEKLEFKKVIIFNVDASDLDLERE